MDISSSHDTTPTSDESHPQRHEQRNDRNAENNHRSSNTGAANDYNYDNSQDKTPPSSSMDLVGTPSPQTHHASAVDQNHQQGQGGSLSSNLLSALKPSIPALTPSLARFYKESLIGHVTNWPAEAVERTCQRINEEHLNLSNLGITKVSTELKMARSLVRLAEIQATLQEQRILFLKQQSLDLESMRPRVAYLHSISSNNEAVETASSQQAAMAAMQQAAASVHNDSASVEDNAMDSAQAAANRLSPNSHNSVVVTSNA